MVSSKAHGLVIKEAHFPGSAPIEAYGNGGFRFAGMSHRGGILILPSGIYAWDASLPEHIIPERMERVFAESANFGLLLIGMGPKSHLLETSTRQSLQAAQISFEFTSTGAAVRTYNVLLAEGRTVAAALLPVDDIHAERIR